MNYANQISYTDVHPFEVVRRVSDKTLDVRAMHAVLDASWVPDFEPGGFCGTVVNQRDQKWVITSDDRARVVRIRLGKQGWKDANGGRYQLSDEPVKFHDYNF